MPFQISFFLVVLLFGFPAKGFAKTPSEIRRDSMGGIVRVEMYRPGKEPSRGTGFIVGDRGFVITARHVLEGYSNSEQNPIKVRIGTLGGIEVDAELVPKDYGLDIALLKLPSPEDANLPQYKVLIRGDSSKLADGDPLVVIGFNLTSNLTVTGGILGSTLGGGSAGNLLLEAVVPGALFGMSGSPVFSANGSVIGIVKGGKPGTSILLFYPEQLLEDAASLARWKSRTEISPELGGRAMLPEGAVVQTCYDGPSGIVVNIMKTSTGTQNVVLVQNRKPIYVESIGGSGRQYECGTDIIIGPNLLVLRLSEERNSISLYGIVRAPGGTISQLKKAVFNERDGRDYIVRVEGHQEVIVHFGRMTDLQRRFCFVGQAWSSSQGARDAVAPPCTLIGNPVTEDRL